MTIQEAIQRACNSTPPRSKARMNALADVRWVLRSRAGYLRNSTSFFDKLTFVDRIGDATIFDGRDNEEMKRRYFEALTGHNLTIELVTVK